MAKRDQNALKIIHDAIADPVARAVLGALSAKDLEVLASRSDENTLAASLQPLLDHEHFDNAFAAMPDDVGHVARKLPEFALIGVKSRLAGLSEDGGPVTCKCR